MSAFLEQLHNFTGSLDAGSVACNRKTQIDLHARKVHTAAMFQRHRFEFRNDGVEKRSHTERKNVPIEFSWGFIAVVRCRADLWSCR
jgi:hypothetical protein